MLRTVAIQFAALGGNVYLYRRLRPADFGSFAIVQIAVAFFAFFGDAGLGGALIQKKEEPTQKELSSVWSLQLCVSLVVIAVVWVGAPWIVRFWPDLPPAGVWVLRALSVDFLLTALRVIPTILMERSLQFGRLSIVEFVLTASFYLTAVTLAFLGFGVMSLVGAVLVQGLVGVVGAYLMRPWRPSLSLDREVLRPILRFGISFQMKNILGFMTGAVSPVYGGRALGQTSVGYINWAQNTAFFPLTLVGIIGRVSFPLYSRLQGDRRMFALALEKSVQVCAITTLAFVGLFLGLGTNLVHVIFTDQWAPALPLLYIFAIAIAIGFVTPVVATALDALGKPTVTLRLAAISTLLIWTLVPLATYLWGVYGFVGAYAFVVWTGNVLLMIVARQVIPGAHLVRPLGAPFAAAAALALFGRFVLSPRIHGPVSLFVAVLLGLVVYVAVLALLDRAAVRDAISFARRKQLATEEPAAPTAPPAADAAPESFRE